MIIEDRINLLLKIDSQYKANSTLITKTIGTTKLKTENFAKMLGLMYGNRYPAKSRIANT